MKTLAPFLILILLPAFGYAQSDATNPTGTVTGTIVDNQEKPLAAANVAVINPQADEVITGTTANKSGEFELRLAPGSYTLRVSFLSYKTHKESFSVKNSQTISLGKIILPPANQKMDETVVRAQKSEMEMSFDRRVFNVGKDITSLGGSAINVLRNVPSISMDIDGNISLRGNQSVRVLINGHRSNMVSNGIQALRSIPSNLIKRVEIITNPSSKYSAEGSGGIINIVLVKDRQLGLNGSVGVGTGVPQDHDISTNLNYQKGNMNWFMNGSFGYRADPEGGNSFQRFSGPDTTYMYRQNTDSDESELDGDIRLGTDYYFSKTQTLTASTFINLEKNSDNANVTYTDLTYAPGAFDGNIIRRELRANDQDGYDHDYDFNLRYDNRIDGDAHRLTADARFEISNESSNTAIHQTLLQGPGEPLFQHTNDGENQKEFRANVEYKRPLGEKSKLEAGLRSNIEWNNNSYFVEQRENGTYVPLSEFNGNFLYWENVNAAYLILGSTLGDFSGEVGLRAENTRIRTEIEETKAVNNQNYLNIFPSVFLTYTLNDKNSLQLSYSRRLSRPRSRELIPFTDYSNSRSQFIGNPNLTPEFSNSYEAGYQRSWKGGSALTSFYYRYRMDVTERISQQQQGVLQRFPINLATEKAWGIEFSGNQDIISGLNLRANANFFRSDRNGSYQQQIFSSEAQSFRTRARLRWDIGDALHYQASFRYRGPQNTTQGRRNGIKTMDTGLSYDLWKGKARISLSLRDIFNSQNFNNITTTDGNPNTDFYSQRSYRWSSRSFSVHFRYFFSATGGANRAKSGRR